LEREDGDFVLYDTSDKPEAAPVCFEMWKVKKPDEPVEFH